MATTAELEPAGPHGPRVGGDQAPLPRMPTFREILRGGAVKAERARKRAWPRHLVPKEDKLVRSQPPPRRSCLEQDLLPTNERRRRPRRTPTIFDEVEDNSEVVDGIFHDARLPTEPAMQCKRAMQASKQGRATQLQASFGRYSGWTDAHHLSESRPPPPRVGVRPRSPSPRHQRSAIQRRLAEPN